MNPHLLPKVRSTTLGDDCRSMGCQLRLGTFIGIPCSNDCEQVHLDGIAPALGKGVGTKVSDLNSVGGCRSCHNILAKISGSGWQRLMDTYPTAAQRQIHFAHMTTIAHWLGSGAIIVPDGEII